MNEIGRIYATLKLFTLGGALFLLPHLARAQSPPLTCEDWAAVDKWTGTIHVRGSGTSTDQNGNTYKVQESETITFTTTTGPGNCDGINTGWSWTGQNSDVTASVNIQNEEDTTCLDKNNNPHPYKITYSVSGGTFPFNFAQIDLDYSDPANPKYLAEPSQDVNGVNVNFMPDPACGHGGTAI
jgi:hypothetical protein